MIEADRIEFDRQLGLLFAGIDKPLGESAREAFWKGLVRMSITEFARCVDLLLAELAERESLPTRFGVADVWQAKRRLRAKAPESLIQMPAPDGWEGDRWDAEANRKLFGHIRRTLAVNSRRYGDPGGSFREPSEQFAANVRRLVAAKRAWAADMRDLDTHGGAVGVPTRIQRRCWDDLIERAEAQIAQAT